MCVCSVQVAARLDELARVAKDEEQVRECIMPVE